VIPDTEEENVPERRPVPPVPPVSTILPGEVGRTLEDFLRHLRDGYSGTPAPHTHPGLPAPGGVTLSADEMVALSFFLGGC
jgi:hypothetical protein